MKLNWKTSIPLLIIAAISIFLLLFAGSCVSYRNRERELRNSFNAIVNSNKVDYDAMWKIIGQVSQVPKEYSKDFKDAYTSMITSQKNADQSSIQNLMVVALGMKPPQLDPSLYRKIQDTVESQRMSFAYAQKQQLDIKREHDNLRTTFPSSMFVGGVSPLEIKLVTSEKTEKSFETGKDDDISLFPSKK